MSDAESPPRTPPMPPSRLSTAADEPGPSRRGRRPHPVLVLLLLTTLVLAILVGALLVGIRVTHAVVADWLRGDAVSTAEVADPPAPRPMRSDVDQDAALAQLRDVADQAVVAAGEGSWGDDPAIRIETFECGGGGAQFLAVDTFTGDPLAAERIEQVWAEAGVGAGASVVVSASATADASGARLLIASDCIAPSP